MSKILVVGNSLAVKGAIEDIRQKDQDSEISLLCTESFLPYDRALLPSLIAGEIKDADMAAVDQGFLKQHKVQVIANEKVARVSLKRKYITTETKKQIEFDQLMVADLGSLMPLAVKGHQKKGVFDCILLSSVKEMIKFAPFVDTVFITVTNLQGFNTACALHALGKEVVLLASDTYLLSSVFDEETGSLLKQILETKGLRVMTALNIEEILGDAEVKAVKLSSGKVIAAQMVVSDNLNLDLRLLETEGDHTIIQDDFLSRTEFVKPSKFGFKVLDGFCIGITKLPEGGREYLKFDGPQNVFKKIFAQGDVLVGGVLFNAPSFEKELQELIAQQISVLGREESLIGG